LRGKRIVVKVGSSSLTEANGKIARDKVKGLASQMAGLIRQGVELILVSSGAVAAGLERLGWSRAQITTPEKQAAAAVGQGILIEMYQQLFAAEKIQIAQLLLTRADVEERKRFIHIRNTIETLLRRGILPIVNENDTVAVEEIRFGDNDTLGSLVALVAEADSLVMLTDIDGLYTANPARDPNARRILEVAEITQSLKAMAGKSGSQVGTGGMQTKLTAAEIATQSGIETVIAASQEPDVLKKIVSRQKVGTWFHPHHRLSGKKSWLAYGTRVEGSLTVDAGAAKALIDHHGSLLLAGVEEVSGEFLEGAAVAIMKGDGDRIGKGIVHFSSHDLRLLLERKKQGIKQNHYPVVIHRDAMVILVREGKRA
jgi:glutamate 5-kinase